MAKKPTYEEMEDDARHNESMEDESSNSELWLNSIFNSIDEAVLVVTPDRKLININKAAQKMFGYLAEELYELSTSVLHVDDEHYHKFGEKIKKAFDDGKTAKLEFEAKRKNGEIFPTEHTVSLLKNNIGESVGIVSIVRDITERKKAEESLIESEERFRSFLKVAFEAIILHEDGILIEANDQYYNMFGYKPHELLNRQTFPLTVAPESMDFLKSQINSGSTASYETIGLKKNGEKFPIEIHSREIKYKGRSVRSAAIKDLTRQKQVEDGLHQSARELSIRNRIAEIFLTTPDDKMYDAALKVVLEAMGSKYGTFAYINEDGDRVVPSMTGDIWEKCRMLNKSIFFPRKAWGDVLWARCIIEKRTISSNGPFKVPDGHVQVSRALAAPIIYKGEVIGNFMVGDKATDYDKNDEELLETIADHVAPVLKARLQNEIHERERKQAEEELRSSLDREQLLGDIIRNASVAIGMCYPDGRLGICNAAFQELTGYSEEELRMIDWNAVLTPPEWRRLEAVKLEELHRTKRAVRYEKECIHKDGSIVPIEVVTHLRLDNDGNIESYFGFITDITERKRFEEELTKHQEYLEKLVEERTAELTRTNEQLQLEIDERKRAEDALLGEKEFAESIVKTAQAIVLVLDKDGRIVRFNPYMEEVSGYKIKEVQGKDWLSTFLPERDSSRIRGIFQRAVGDIQTRGNVNTIITKDGQKRQIEWYDKTLKDTVGNVTGLLTIGHDTTEKLQAQEALRKSEEKFRTVADFTYDWEYWIAPDGRYVYVSPSFERITGFDPDVLPKDVWLLEKIAHPDDRSIITRHLQEELDKAETCELDFRIVTKNGDTRWIGHVCQPVYASDGRFLGRRASNRDVTDTKMAENEIKEALKEKEVLLAEIHHRVKNNFQIISSLLDMITMRTQNQEAIDLLTDARSKIYSMALVYTQLYEEKRFDRIDFGSYVERLVDHTGQVYSSRGILVTPVVESSDVRLSLNQAVPCALVLNEVISNVYKHAFKKGEQGRIEVSFRRAADNMVLIRVKDDGIGIPEEMDIDKAKTLGLKLVKNLVQSQLKGKLQVKRDNGTEIIIEFKAVTEGEEDA